MLPTPPLHHDSHCSLLLEHMSPSLHFEIRGQLGDTPAAQGASFFLKHNLRSFVSFFHFQCVIVVGKAQVKRCARVISCPALSVIQTPLQNHHVQFSTIDFVIHLCASRKCSFLKIMFLCCCSWVSFRHHVLSSTKDEDFPLFRGSPSPYSFPLTYMTCFWLNQLYL